VAAHSHSRRPGPADEAGHRRALVVAVAVVSAAVLVGLVLLWPARPSTVRLGSAEVAHGTVTATRLQDCAVAQRSCTVVVTVRVTDGPDRGRDTQLTFLPGATDPKLEVGEHIRMGRQGSGAGAVYAFADVERRGPLLLLAAVFVIVVLVTGRLRGLAAMLGLAIAGAGLVWFVLPALLAGESPTLVALVGGAAITLAVLPLAHGVSVRTGAALIGTLAGMAIAALLAAVSVSALRFTGTSNEEGTMLQLLGSRSSVSGLLLCGAVIGAIGVLNDVTVTQASAVFELAAADPAASRRRVFSAAMRIGRDHIASTVYSLVFAYAGSALPLLLLFVITGQSVGDVLTGDALGPEIAAGLIGAIALVLVVPLTTFTAVLLISNRRLRPSASDVAQYAD
jgi:uncharacterized membrane protein